MLFFFLLPWIAIVVRPKKPTVALRSQLRDDEEGLLLPPRAPSHGRLSRRKPRRCHICGGFDHLARDCQSKPVGGSTYVPGRRVYVHHLAEATTWQSLKDHFRDAGFEVVYASVSLDAVTGLSKCCGLVQFVTADQADNAIRDMDGSRLDGATIHCREDRQRPRTTKLSRRRRGDGANREH